MDRYLEQLIGSQIMSVGVSHIVVRKNGILYTLELDSDNGDCCGYADFETKLLFSENDDRNPIITDVKNETSGDGCDQSVLTFYGESKPLASIESEAGSGSGWGYGATVTLKCKPLQIDETLVEW